MSQNGLIFCSFPNFSNLFSGKFSRPTFSSIAGLFSACCPAAVILFIITIVVIPLKGQSFVRPTSNITDEVCKLIPSFADTNPTPAIVLPSFISWIRASLDHRRPYVIFWPPLAFTTSTMGAKMSMFKHIEKKTSTTTGNSVPQIIASNCFVRSAGANTIPIRYSGASIFGPGKNFPSSKYLPSEVYEGSMRLNDGRIAVSLPSSIVHQAKPSGQRLAIAASNRTLIFHAPIIASLGNGA